jgi:hypothetical protein
MKKKCNMTLPKVHNSSINVSKDNEVVETPGKEFKGRVLKLINVLKEDSNK